jgi:hypothetical protein
MTSVPTTRAASTIKPTSAGALDGASWAAISAAVIASTAVGFESGPAIANGAPLPSAKTIAMTPALNSPNPIAK